MGNNGTSDMEELFEFDLSDMDVAAFENVATTPPPPQTTIPEAPTIAVPTETQIETPIETETITSTDTTETVKITRRPETPPLATTNITTSQTGQRPCKILLIPINSTFNQVSNIKHLIQLPPGAVLTDNKKHIATKIESQNQQQQNQQQNQQQQHHHHQQQQQQLQQRYLQQQQPRSETPNEVPKRKPCNCTKSQCLKLYCDCFANGEFCSGCNCTNCSNSLDKEKERQKAISQCLERNPEAFRPKIGKAIKASLGEPAPESIERRHTKGCNCKRSGCLKNYCECYEAKILCSNLCKCCGCKNYEESFERKTLMQLANSSSESARGILKNLLPTNNGSNRSKEFAKSFITDEVIRASLNCLLQSAQQAEKDGMPTDQIPNLIQEEMGKCLKMIVNCIM
jgi:hypothetical protein